MLLSLVDENESYATKMQAKAVIRAEQMTVDTETHLQLLHQIIARSVELQLVDMLGSTLVLCVEREKAKIEMLASFFIPPPLL